MYFQRSVLKRLRNAKGMRHTQFSINFLHSFAYDFVNYYRYSTSAEYKHLKAILLKTDNISVARYACTCFTIVYDYNYFGSILHLIMSKINAVEVQSRVFCYICAF